MQRSWTDTIWSTFRNGRYYSVRDIVNLSGEPVSVVNEVLEFLAKFGFVELVGHIDPLYKKSQITASPGESVEFLKTIVGTAVA